MRVLATQMRALGVAPGDRVVAYLPNTPEAIDRDARHREHRRHLVELRAGFRHARRARSLLAARAQSSSSASTATATAASRSTARRRSAQIIGRLPTLEHVIYLPYLDPDDRTPLDAARAVLGRRAVRHRPGREAFQFEQVPFAHPLWILFSSGTTGLPKAIMHCHGGITLEQLKLFHFHMDLHARQRMFFFTTTGWMMWNFLASALLIGRGAGALRRQSRVADAGPAVEDGGRHRARSCSAPARPTRASSRRPASCRRNASISTKLESIVLAGSPVTAECQEWFYENVKKDLWAHPAAAARTSARASSAAW